jgi:hypothetical protein
MSRFIMGLEPTDLAYLLLYSACFWLWLAGEGVNGESSMYPYEGTEAPWEMSAWEVNHCPWYMDIIWWLTPFGDNERLSRRMVDGGNGLQTIFSSVKEEGC